MNFEFKTSLGPLRLELYPDKAPKTVENFAKYVEAGFYNGTVFHRVIKGFMVQGGGFTPGLKEKTTNPTIANEANNGLKNVYGSIAMARTNNPHSASSQFFINIKDNAFLDFKRESPQDWGYCVFGQMIVGKEVLDAMAGVKTGSQGGHDDVPVEDLIIEHIIKLAATTP